MTHLRGDITKIKNILKKGYDQPIVQRTSIEVTQEALVGLAAGAWFVINQPGETPKSGFFKKISITVDNATIMEANLTTISSDGTSTQFWWNYFVINGEYDLGDVPINSDETYVLSFQNNAAGAINFTANISYIEV